MTFFFDYFRSVFKKLVLNAEQYAMVICFQNIRFNLRFLTNKAIVLKKEDMEDHGWMMLV